jgi:hypothetical protein
MSCSPKPRPRNCARPAPTSVPRQRSHAGKTRYFLNSFHPLGATRKGRELALHLGVGPFADNSIRREPDFEHRYPSVTGLCRPHKLVSWVDVGDRIAYVTVKYLGKRFLVALLEVAHIAPDHANAAEWYRSQGLPLPSNCVVAGNDPLPPDHAIPRTKGLTYRAWVRGYQQRASACPRFVICKAIKGPFLTTPPEVPERVFRRPFPGTRGSARISPADFRRLKALK